jgi:penicillin-binding protein 1C
MRPLQTVRGAPASHAPYRMFGESAAYYVRDILAGAALPDGWAMGQGLKRARDIGFKTGTSYGYRDAWAAGFSNDYTVSVWVGRADGAPRPGRMGRNEAAPFLFELFDLLPPDTQPRRAAPATALRATNAAELPPSLRTFSRGALPRHARANPPRIAAPAIAFPPNGAVVSLPKNSDETIELAATGGRAPFTWLVNGALLGSFTRYTPVRYRPDGEGFTRITVVDADGRADDARVRFKR